MKRIILAALAVAALAPQAVMAQTDPALMAKKVMGIVKAQNWKALYAITEFSPRIKATVPKDAAEFARQVEGALGASDPGGANRTRMTKMTDFTTGAIQTKSRGRLAVSTTSKVDGAVSRGYVPLINVNGKLKLDMTLPLPWQQTVNMTLLWIVGSSAKPAGGGMSKA